MIVTGKKYKLKGVACLGRPGVALCIGQRRNIDKFLNKLKQSMPQKKFTSVNLELVDDEDMNNLIDGFEEVPLATLRELLTSIGHEDKFLALVGIDNNNSPSRSSSQPNENQNNLDNSKKDRKKKKRRKG